MSSPFTVITALYTRIPRPHSPDNVKELYAILNSYEDTLQNTGEKCSTRLIGAAVFWGAGANTGQRKKSKDNRLLKKMNDSLFDEASGALKDR